MRSTESARASACHEIARLASVPSKSETTASPSGVRHVGPSSRGKAIELVAGHEHVAHVDHADPVEVGRQAASCPTAASVRRARTE